jgi:hypothetical protein
MRPISLKYSWSNAFLAVIRWLGSKINVFESKSTPAGSSPGTMDARFLGGHFGKADLKSGNEVTPGQVSSFGVPRVLHSQ